MVFLFVVNHVHLPEAMAEDAEELANIDVLANLALEGLAGQDLV